jgi:hypothetical protein
MNYLAVDSSCHRQLLRFMLDTIRVVDTVTLSTCARRASREEANHVGLCHGIPDKKKWGFPSLAIRSIGNEFHRSEFQIATSLTPRPSVEGQSPA